ncbi:DUF5327 family protein [Alkalihalobacillus trypoxylicola]|uniref:Uncharacterized protein n=1 Tax=Alkalihalobacillus trypoxylicola TaxID=519424 RepID=A0A161Q1D1_9BACI|nr:DUF5327 family protein [Alkalihalobacillus trypoxylicola]KYG29293.1 hypothetical protein AZF04_07140 [Alkalihalobacillus trypoxylicola]GAF64382.1 hypothetical protein BTS2_1275 [Bacillus sp. TS-2]
MNISTQSVIQTMKEQIQRLEQAHINNQEEIIKETVTALEAYCRLFKTSQASQSTNQVNSINPSVADKKWTQIQPVSSFSNHIEQSGEPIDKHKGDNLLDF